MTLRTDDGLSLAAWYVPSRNGAAVISYPTRQGRLPQARMLLRHGYGVLLVDARGYDGSDGNPNVFGWKGAKDVDAAVAWLEQRADVTNGRIGGIGFSVGGEVMLEAAASNSGIRAVVSEGAGVRSVREHLLRGRRGWFSLPEVAVQTAAVAVMSGATPPPSLSDLVPRIAPRPLLLVYAGPRRRRRRADDPPLLRSRRRAQDCVEDRRGRPRRRPRGAPARIRAARRRLPRRSATGGRATVNA
ncbi:MAG TPA: alpha/beta fold hydrolase [Gaiellaceae bacterium]|nr:alpha/beta fold hydrolase [Gaiellaceae bacterium]